ncbi:SMI1/KNR4 family protein [Phenylobacterium sp.]|uniref:SMI1/KNR4 family protein n=1 Tax=Phenylobacterium sp. TaxID=1871053 RepID=UPI002723A898|nr:SMI1/KNR4 family protein [Phenylobacterium sp.]MDO8380502.1 SMI1/KNR4 family protein [Phenylobacterium sp.]
MRVSVPEAARRLEEAGALRRWRVNHAERIIARVSEQLGRKLPADLEDFYREGIAEVGEFAAIGPSWNDWMKRWERPSVEMTDLLHAQAVPVFFDGCGNLFGLDLSSGDAVPAVYFFDHERGFEKPVWAAGSSLGTFLLLLADHDRAYAEDWPEDWQLAIDPDIGKCPRAPPLWAAG